MVMEEEVSVLLVDDRPENLLTLEAVLGDLGLALVTANSGVEALRQLLKRDFAVILLDVQMPDMDGFETAALIREREQSRNIPIIFITAIDTTVEHISKGYFVGAVDYLFKPFSPEILRSKVMVFVELFRFRERTKQHALLVQSEAYLREHNAELEKINKKLELEIIERERIEQELKKKTQKLEASNRDLEEFAYIASHDLQEPLRKVLAFSDRLESKYQGLLDETGQDYLNRMQGAVRRMQILIDDLLAFSRVTSQARAFTRVDLSRVAAEVVSDLESRIEKSNGRVVIGPLPVIDADASQIHQLLQNLIGNALKFHAADRTPVVKVSSEKIDENFCQINVADNGIGFDMQYLDRIFKPFQRLFSRETYEGTGMGLAICRRIVERHSGTITANASPGKGATFIIRLPIHQTMEHHKQ
jgi:signal transduction histidine kinase